MRFSNVFLELLTFTSIASAGVIGKRQSTAATQIFKFSSPKSAEGIAVRSNGQILVSFFDKGELWTVDPVTKQGAKAVTLGDATCSAGIVEIAPDVFAVVAGQYGMAGGNKPGSWAIWKVDFTSGNPTASVLKQAPESGMWNGLTNFDSDNVLIGDATKGAIFKMNTKTGDYSIVVQDPTMTPGTGIPMGIDGVRYSNGTVYFTNVSKNTLLKVPVDATGKATGSVTTIYSNAMSDDLWVGPDGSIYVAQGTGGKIAKVSPDGKVSTVASVSSPTAVTLGRTAGDENTLYIASSAGMVASVKV